jgi:hypothetical protein
MARAVCSVHEAKCSDTAHICTPNSEPAKFEFTQVMNASKMSDPVDTPDYYSTRGPYTWMTNNDFRHIEPEEDEVIVIPGKFLHVFCGCNDTHFAGMAPPAKRHDDLSGLLTVDCGATTTLTKELLNMTNVSPKVVTIQLAMVGATMKSTHVGIKTYYIYDRTGTLQPISIAGIYPVADDRTIDAASIC